MIDAFKAELKTAEFDRVNAENYREILSTLYDQNLIDKDGILKTESSLIFLKLSKAIKIVFDAFYELHVVVLVVLFDFFETSLQIFSYPQMRYL